MNVEECRRVTRRVWTNVDKWGRTKNFFPLISEKVTHSPIFLLLQLRNYANYPINAIMQIFNFIVLSVINAHHSIFIPHISKTHLPISSLNVRELALNWCSRDQSRKMGAPNAWGVGSRTPPCKTLTFMKRNSLSLWSYASSKCG